MAINLLQQQILLLADAHIKMYEKRLASDSPYVNKVETTRLLTIWISIQTKKGAWLTRDETTEIRDAVDSGEFDELLGK